MACEDVCGQHKGVRNGMRCSSVSLSLLWPRLCGNLPVYYVQLQSDGIQSSRRTDSKRCGVTPGHFEGSVGLC